ncbi:MAG: prepilin-type N-terminal cleavage/methylation domain-containing protein [Hydrogenophaga sp.]|uniref:prepilin-type N-terminal cleavage/methylation domain-containing protein n=1 Tax=Hydrogenophaga sp. TaxID=1904254 RepID=UPI002771064C|nr:prepilin-type N-terminal cleavage/methylation domain-containing protein [Hydrogenophaga sp.]MDP2416621.1 prepilin-type N-terminal cleavage/methylation domain-containing protein [Hydrogenophaga sp.]MDZ4188498.1 prepilin-type N-terminal cleavage/methylation domain-containing protein [Hydrogenophaga sp.]
MKSMSLRSSRKGQAGFTLVEIAIVLVIIGLLLGGVLKGQELIENAKIKNLANDIRGVTAAYYTYVDRYRAVPGDDLFANTRFTGVQNGGGNGLITGVYATNAGTLTAATESNNFWQHLRAAGLVSGSGSAPPTHAFGGLLGVQSEVTAADGSTYGMVGPVLCVGNLPWKVAQALDTLIDDGSSATGSGRAGAASATANFATVGATASVYGPGVTATAALEAGRHTFCVKL